MNHETQSLETLKDIRKMMDRSSRFISLSGLSGIAAGTCALVSAWYTATELNCWKLGDCLFENLVTEDDGHYQNLLIRNAIITFVAAFSLAFLFTWLRSKKTNTQLFGSSSKRLAWNIAVPMITGGIFLLRMIQLGAFGLIAPACLLFYGLALINAGKYTLSEVKYLGYCIVILGLINLWFIGYGLYFWAMGFGVLHIIYGAIMWWRYERKTISE
jgi:hypothetical protein